MGVAALSAAAGLLGGAGMPVWLLASVGEEGLGNLCGVSAALDAPPEPVGAFIAVEGNYLGRVSAVGVGSVRRRITVTGPGGHAWEAPDAPSAVHAVAGLVSEIASMSPIDGTSVNAGRIGGGEGINVRAREAWFELDLRADDPRTLAALARDVDAIVARIDEPLHVERTVLGDRPAGRLDPSHPLVRAAGDALREAGIEVRPVATSTDANAAHARGIPAIAIGVTTGSGEHTPRSASPRVAIIMLTAFEDEEQLFQTMKLGAAAYLLKGISPEELVDAVRKVSRGIYIINDNVLSRPTVAKRVLRVFREMTAEEPPEVQPLYSPLSRQIEILDYMHGVTVTKRLRSR